MGSFLGQFFLFQIIFKYDIRSFGTILGQFNPSRTPESQFLGFGPTPAIPKIGPEIGFLENRDFQKYRVGVELEAETFTNRLSVQSYVGHAPQVFGLIFASTKLSLKNLIFNQFFRILAKIGQKSGFRTITSSRGRIRPKTWGACLT